jgi:hypothetical protein
MASSHRRGGTLTMWICSWCRGGAEDEQSLLDHQEWCLGDGIANTRMLEEIVRRDGELTQEALVAAARLLRERSSGDRSTQS